MFVGLKILITMNGGRILNYLLFMVEYKYGGSVRTSTFPKIQGGPARNLFKN